MTRLEIIAQLDAELSRLESARDFLRSALKDSKSGLLRAGFIKKVTTRLPNRVVERSVTRPASASASVAAVAPEIADAPKPGAAPKLAPRANPAPKANAASRQAALTKPTAPEPLVEHTVSRIPPRRRMGPRQFPADKKSSAALSGLVPKGPVAVSANEARKVQDRVVAAPPLPKVAELHAETNGERSLSSLIQAFERRSGMSGIEIP